MVTASLFFKSFQTTFFLPQPQTLLRVHLRYLEGLVKKITKNLDPCEPTFCSLNKKKKHFFSKKKSFFQL
jgi:hypothetical protein